VAYKGVVYDVSGQLPLAGGDATRRCTSPAETYGGHVFGSNDPDSLDHFPGRGAC